MSYVVFLESRAQRDLRALQRDTLQRVDAVLTALSDNPRPRGALKLRGGQGQGWRIRIGDYRILYTVDDEAQTVRVYRISHRRDVYRSLRGEGRGG